MQTVNKPFPLFPNNSYMNCGIFLALFFQATRVIRTTICEFCKLYFVLFSDAFYCAAAVISAQVLSKCTSLDLRFFFRHD